VGSEEEGSMEHWYETRLLQESRRRELLREAERERLVAVSLGRKMPEARLNGLAVLRLSLAAVWVFLLQAV
jgi:hypothetical protein